MYEIIVLICFALSTAVLGLEPAYRCSSPEGIFRNPYDCSQFFICRDGQVYPLICDDGKMFDIVDGKCKSSSGCVIDRQCHEPEASNYCDQYYDCVHNTKVIRFCDHGQGYDEEKKEC